MIATNQIIRAIDDTLSSWIKLDEKHRGPLYGDAVKSLEDWKKKLMEEANGKQF